MFEDEQSKIILEFICRSHPNILTANEIDGRDKIQMKGTVCEILNSFVYSLGIL
jgi:hypothetical protein